MATMSHSSSVRAYRVNDACGVLGIGRTSLYKLIKSGQLKPIKILGRTVIPVTEIDRVIAEGLTNA
jgi:excisionase family DNA binding protein